MFPLAASYPRERKRSAARTGLETHRPREKPKHSHRFLVHFGPLSCSQTASFPQLSLWSTRKCCRRLSGSAASASSRTPTESQSCMSGASSEREKTLQLRHACDRTLGPARPSSSRSSRDPIARSTTSTLGPGWRMGQGLDETCEPARSRMRVRGSRESDIVAMR